MNSKQRKILAPIVDQLEQVSQTVESLTNDISDMQQEERDKFDGLSEGLQMTTVGLSLEVAADALQEAQDAMEEVVGLLEDAVEAINRAINGE